MLGQMIGDEPQREENDEAAFPSVSLAFDFFVHQSYEWMLRRFDAIEKRIITLQNYATTVTLAVPVFAKSIVNNVGFDSRWFGLALFAFVVLMILGLLARTWGGLTHISPGIVFDRWLHLSEHEFKRDLLFFAGEHFKQNQKVVNRRGNIVTGMTVLFVAEVLLLIVWIRSL